MKKTSNIRSQKLVQGAWVAICASLLLASQALGGEITSIDTFDNTKVIQRVGHTGTIHLSGQFSDSLSDVYARVISSTSGVAVTSWTAITVTNQGSQWFGDFTDIPEGGWYYPEVKAGTGGNVIQGGDRFGVGVVVAFIGQSNLEMNFNPYIWNNPSPNEEETALKRWSTLCSIYNAGEDAWGNQYTNIVAGGVHWNTNHYWNVGGHFAQILGYNLVEELGIPVGLVNAAWGGTRIKHWTQKDNYFHYLGHGDYPVWDSFVGAMEHAGGDAEIVVWHQGYSDMGEYPDSPDGYKDELDALYTQLTNLLPRTSLPIICGVEGRRHMFLTNSVLYSNEINRIQGDSEDRAFDNIRGSQMRWANEHSYVYRGPNAIDIRIKNSGHFDPRDRLLWASKMSQCLLYVLGEETYSGSGTFFDETQSSLQGNVVTLKVNHEGGNQLVIPSPDEPVEGFLFSQDEFASYINVTSSEIVQSNALRIVLEETPTNKLYFRYLTGKCPIFDIDPDTTSADAMEVSTNFPPGNIVYDNAVLPHGNFRESLGLGSMVNGTIGQYEVSTDDHLLPWTETFESDEPKMAGVLGDADEQHGWEITGVGSAVVQNSEVHSGSQALAITKTSATHSYFGSPSNVWITLWAKPIPTDVPKTPTTIASAAFYVGTNDLLIAYNSTHAVELAGASVSNGWNKFEIHCDYVSKVWNLSLNDEQVVTNFSFYGTPERFSALKLIEADTNTAYVDSIHITDGQTQADTDADGLPNGWETQYFGGAISADPNATASNGINTVREAYIANIDPTDPNAAFLISALSPMSSESVLQWSAVSGRVYTVYWASNLLSGFGEIPLTNGITGGAFTDLIHGAESKGFYKIDVELE